MTIVSPAPRIPRDPRHNRPLVIPPEGGTKRVSYRRVTTFIDVLEDKYKLGLWAQRMVALGLASRPDLLLSVSAHKDEKEELDAICKAAREAASASAAAITGTALHALTELVDRGQELPPLPPGAKASLDEYVKATEVLKCVHIEQFMTLDALKLGGTPDRIVKHDGQLKIADVKTGSIDLGALKIAMQLAIYSRSWLYDAATDTRHLTGVSTTEGIVIHLPATDDPAEARCDLYRIDLEAGWFAVQVAMRVWEKRAIKFKDVMQPLTASTDLADQLAASISLENRIKACTTADDVRALWAAHASEWDDALTAVAKGHIASLPAVS